MLDEANAYERGMDDDLTLAKRLCWDSYEWDGVDSDCVAKDEDDAWDYAGETAAIRRTSSTGRATCSK